VQRNAMRSFAEQRDFKSLLLTDTDITRVLSPLEIERAFDVESQFQHVDTIFERVFTTPFNLESAGGAEPVGEPVASAPSGSASELLRKGSG